MTPPDLSVIIPVFNRGDLIRYTLESARRASQGLPVEIIVVDDGSVPPASEILGRLGFTPDILIRQANQGLLFARLAGLERATGQHVLFLDSDDLVSADKFRLQLSAMAASHADISYSDWGQVALEGAWDDLHFVPDPRCLDTTDTAEFFIRVQPPPHSPIFRRDYLQRVVQQAFFPPDPAYNLVAEIWFYHNAAPRDGRVVKVPGFHTWVGTHPASRLTNHWEKLGLASLSVMEAFSLSCPRAPETQSARRLVGEAAFRAWRRLPRGFSRDFERRLLTIWRQLAPGFSPALGGGLFASIARVVGSECAGRLFRQWQAPSYKHCRTLDPATLDALRREIASASPS